MNPQTVARRVLDPQTPIPESQRAYLLGLGVKTVLMLPLSSGGQVNGRLTFRFAEEREFQPEELEIARALAIQASLAIQLTRLANAARQSAVMEERNQLAGEIHDSLAQFFTGISMQLDAAKEVLKKGDNKGLIYLERAAELAQFGLAEARRSAYSLQPSLTEGLGLAEALQKLVERSNVPGRLRCNFHASDVPKNACRARPGTSCSGLRRKPSATRCAMPSRPSSASAFGASRLTCSSRSPTTARASLSRSWPAGMSLDFPVCGPGQKTWAPNSMFERRRVAAPASLCAYRSLKGGLRRSLKKPF